MPARVAPSPTENLVTRAQARDYCAQHQLEEKLAEATSRAVNEGGSRPLARIAALLLEADAAAARSHSVVDVAVASARERVEGPVAEDTDDGYTAWSVAGWVDSLDVDRVVSAALTRPLGDVAASSAAQLQYMRSLATHGSVETLEQVLGAASGRLVAGIAEVLWESTGPLREKRAASARELHLMHSKFVQDEQAVTLEYGTLDTFFGGLERMVGPPSANLSAAMDREHTQSANSDAFFSTGNYKTETCPRFEWWFVTDPVEGLRRLGLAHYPQEPGGVTERRKPQPPSAFSVARRHINDRLAAQQEQPLKMEELVGARLYTGPMFTLYNTVLRGIGPNKALRAKMLRLTQGERYVTTLHVINSAVVKLGKLQRATKVYRGLTGKVLPDAFWRENQFGVKGGVERAFMSTTTSQEVAMAYASRDGRGGGIVYEIDMGMVDRGADLSWLSQYPTEAEILFAPLTGIEVKGTAVRGSVLVVHVRLNVNLTALTIEQVVAKMRHSHLHLLEMFKDDFRFAGAPSAVLTRWEDEAREAAARDAEWYNSGKNYLEATKDVLELRTEALEQLAAPAVWAAAAEEEESLLNERDDSSSRPPAVSSGRRGSLLNGSYDSSAAVAEGAVQRRMARRMLSCAELCARDGAARAACALLRLALQRAPLPAEPAAAVRAVLHEAACAGAPAGAAHGAEGDAAEAARRLEAEAWRLEAAHQPLVLGALDPWPEVLATLVTSYADDAPEPAPDTAAALARAMAALTGALQPKSMSRCFAVGAEVLAYDLDLLSWAKARIEVVLPDGAGFDVLVGGWHQMKGIATERCVAVCEDGAGAMLLAAARQGNAALVTALYDVGVPPFVCTAKADTALHLMARLGHTDACRAASRHPLFQRDSERWGGAFRLNNRAGESPSDLATEYDHLEIRRLFQPTLFDLELQTEHEAEQRPEWRGDEPARALRAAARAGDAAALEALLAQGVPPDAASETARLTALQLACGAPSETHGGCVAMLLAARAAVDAASTRGCTPLITAAAATGSADSEPTVRALLDAGAAASVNRAQSDGDTALIHACRYGRAAVAQLLLSARADVDTVGHNGNTGATWAAQIGSLDTLRVLIEATPPADINKANDRGEAPLHLACKYGQEFCVDMLLKAGGRVAARRTKDGFTPLHMLAKFEHTEPIAMLLEAGGGAQTEVLEAASDTGQTPLMIAAAYGLAQAVEALLAAGADANARRDDGTSPLLLACAREGDGDDEVVRMLVVRGGAEVDAANAAGETALHLSSRIGHETATAILLELGADPAVRSATGMTPLMLASLEGHEESVRELVEVATPAQLNATVSALHPEPTLAGRTPLQLAARNGHEEVVQELLDANADISYGAADGTDALSVATACGHEAVVALLKRAAQNAGSTLRLRAASMVGSTQRILGPSRHKTHGSMLGYPLAPHPPGQLHK